jgi:Protein of unknown function (DUF3025)
MSPLRWPIAAALARFGARDGVPRVAQIDKELSSSAGVRFVPAPPRPRRRVTLDRSRLYDARITQSREVPTREGSLHDFMNALVWASFPRAKMALHVRQHALIDGRIEGSRLPEHRTPEQDMLAMVDEGGIAVLTAEVSAVEAATQARDAGALARLVAAGRARPAVFGHALFEHLARNSVPLVWGRAMVLFAPDPPEELEVSVFDARLAQAIAAREVDRDVGSAPLVSSVLTSDEAA